MDSEKLIKVFDAFVRRDCDSFYRVAWDIIEEEKRKKRHLLAKRLKQILTDNGVSSNITTSRQIPPVPRDNEKGFRLLDVKKLFLDCGVPPLLVPVTMRDLARFPKLG